jgi:hypothetical protein
MARPPKPINWDIVEKRIEAGNSAATISKAFSIDVSNFYDRFKKEFGCDFASFAHKAPETRDDNIAYTQYMKALSGNVTMLIRLGSVWLGQREPELLSTIPPLQQEIDKDHMIMMLQHELAELKANADKSEAR